MFKLEASTSTAIASFTYRNCPTHWHYFQIWNRKLTDPLMNLQHWNRTQLHSLVCREVWRACVCVFASVSLLEFWQNRIHGDLPNLIIPSKREAKFTTEPIKTIVEFYHVNLFIKTILILNRPLIWFVTLFFRLMINSLNAEHVVKIMFFLG